MENVTGIGRLLFQVGSSGSAFGWYEQHFGIAKTPRDNDAPVWVQRSGQTVFAPFPCDTDCFGKATPAYALNFSERDLDGIVPVPEKNDIEVTRDPEQYPNGRFEWLHSPDETPIGDLGTCLKGTTMKWLDMPPFWLLGFATAAYGQAHYLSFGLSLAHPVTVFLAGLLVGAGLILVGLAAVEFRKHRTTIVPHQIPDQLIQTGVFKRSRNPIYLADVLILTGLVLWWDAVLSLVLVPILFWVLETRFVIPEENRLRKKFRADFARYAQKTRRWV